MSLAQALQPVPAFDLESIDGTRFTSKALAGKVGLVDFWATWCAPCIAEIPQWNELYTRYQSKGLVVVGMTIRSGWASDIKPDAAKLKMAYPVVVGNDDVEKGFGGIWGFPTTFLVNRKGQFWPRSSGYCLQCRRRSARRSPKAQKPDRASVQLRFAKDGTVSTSCSETIGLITQSILQVEGVKNATIDAKNNGIQVSFDPGKTTPQKIVVAFNKENPDTLLESPDTKPSK